MACGASTRFFGSAGAVPVRGHYDLWMYSYSSFLAVIMVQETDVTAGLTLLTLGQSKYRTACERAVKCCASMTYCCVEGVQANTAYARDFQKTFPTITLVSLE